MGRRSCVCACLGENFSAWKEIDLVTYRCTRCLGITIAGAFFELVFDLEFNFSSENLYLNWLTIWSQQDFRLLKLNTKVKNQLKECSCSLLHFTSGKLKPSSTILLWRTSVVRRSSSMKRKMPATPSSSDERIAEYLLTPRDDGILLQRFWDDLAMPYLFCFR